MGSVRRDGVLNESKQTKKMLILDTHFSIESHRVKPYYVLSPMTIERVSEGPLVQRVPGQCLH